MRFQDTRFLRWTLTECSDMRSPLGVLREANRRKRSAKIETPLDLIRALNRERRRRVTAQRILERLG